MNYILSVSFTDLKEKKPRLQRICCVYALISISPDKVNGVGIPLPFRHPTKLLQSALADSARDTP